MIDYSEAALVDWPLEQASVVDGTATLLRGVFLDAGAIVEANRLSTVSTLRLAWIALSRSGSDISVSLSFKMTWTGGSAIFQVSFDSTQSWVEDDVVRLDYTSDGSETVSGTPATFSLWLALGRPGDLFSLLPDGLDSKLVPVNRDFVPTVVTNLAAARVEKLAIENSSPLLVSTTATVPDGEVSGDIKLIAGANCSLFMTPSNNTMVISARKGSADRDSVCGVWSEPVTESDILCSQVYYAVAGAEPNDTGNVRMSVEYPLSIKSDTVASKITIGLMTDTSNASIFNCK